jgi:hypothetical protein
MKAKLKFDLNDPDERHMHSLATNSIKLAAALLEIERLIKNFDDSSEDEDRTPIANRLHTCIKEELQDVYSIIHET